MKQYLFFMLNELAAHKRDKSVLLPRYIEERLNKSFSVYNTELQQSIQFLTRKHEKSLIKRMKKVNDKSN